MKLKFIISIIAVWLLIFAWVCHHNDVKYIQRLSTRRPLRITQWFTRTTQIQRRIYR